MDHNKDDEQRYPGRSMDDAVHDAKAEPRQPSVQPTIGGSVYVKPQDIDWAPTQFDGISIKILYVDKPNGEMTCLLRGEPGATLPMHKHPEIEQTFVLEGSFYDHDGICRAGEFVWRRVASPAPRTTEDRGLARARKG
jgi:hypothetical protein